MYSFPSRGIHQDSYPSLHPLSSPVLQLHLIHDDGRDILLRKLRLSELPGDLSMLGLPESVRELCLLDLGVLDLGEVDTGVVGLSGEDVGVDDIGGGPLGVVDSGGLPLGVVDFGLLELGLLDRLPHQEVDLLPLRE